MGVLVAFSIVLVWFCSIWFSLNTNEISLWSFFWIALNTHLFTGLFITAHDAMHGSISKVKWINSAFGWICASLFAFNYYPKLFENHHRHHKFVAQESDPDYNKGNFWQWYFSFMVNYSSVWQFIFMAIWFNILLRFFSIQNIWLFYLLPTILSSLQLFYFGTYLPHKPGKDNVNLHFARTQHKNHLWAFMSCYFFGYHFEHHQWPHLPWWKLWKTKSN